MANTLRVTLVGVYFGILLVKSEVVRWERVHAMFRLEEAHMYLVIGTAIVVSALLLALLRRIGARDVNGELIRYEPKPYHVGVVLGGLIFGMGWAITGACPGPIYAQIGAGAWPALITFAGAMAGLYLYAALRPRLPR